MPVPVSSDPDAKPAATSERFSVTLVLAAVTAVGTLMRITGLSKTDVINRSVQVYAFLTEQTREGKEILLRDSDKNLERVHII
ncbi:hypothetical protein [Streptomyces abikoensis]|uniref:Uncharacterized protein n=1 Tax=Streptomyces abikoensis TaxID=97398 RepID=A0ABW7T274_9ACTN